MEKISGATISPPAIVATTEDAQRIDAVRQAMKKTKGDFWEIGRLLHVLRDKSDHGKHGRWKPFLEQTFPELSYGTLARWMRLYDSNRNWAKDDGAAALTGWGEKTPKPKHGETEGDGKDTPPKPPKTGKRERKKGNLELALEMIDKNMKGTKGETCRAFKMAKVALLMFAEQTEDTLAKLKAMKDKDTASMFPEDDDDK